VTLGSVVLVTGAAGAAAAGAWARWFDSPSSTESVTGEAYVDVRSPEMTAAIDRAIADYPLPPGTSWQDWRRALRESGGLKQVAGMRGEAALYGGCPWTRQWLAADSRDDAAARSAAARALDRIADSPDAAAVDGGGIVDAARERAAAATRGDAEWLTRYSATWCTGQ
jgi:hypothetical protein